MKWNFYKSKVTDGVERWLTKKKIEAKLVKMHMLGWLCGVYKKRIEFHTAKLTDSSNITEKLRNSIWCRH